jgi:5'(3')-deoxyribonucleotidase
MEKEILYLDMDGVLVNLNDHIKLWFELHPHLKERFEKFPDHIHGIFRDPQPIDGAIEGVYKLHKSGKYDLFIASAAPWGNPDAASDKRYWNEKYFGNLFHKRMFITHRKDLLIGNYLVDDSLGNGAKEFNGTLLRFGTDYKTGQINEFPNWDSLLNRLL